MQYSTCPEPSIGCERLSGFLGPVPVLTEHRGATDQQLPFLPFQTWSHLEQRKRDCLHEMARGWNVAHRFTAAPAPPQSTPPCRSPLRPPPALEQDGSSHPTGILPADWWGWEQEAEGRGTFLRLCHTAACCVDREEASLSQTVNPTVFFFPRRWQETPSDLFPRTHGFFGVHYEATVSVTARCPADLHQQVFYSNKMKILL